VTPVTALAGICQQSTTRVDRAPAVSYRSSMSAASTVRNFIGGEWAAGAVELPVLDKFSQDVIATALEPDRAQVAAAVAAAQAASAQAPPSPVERARILFRTAELVEARREAFYDLMAAEAGFTRADSSNEVDRAVVTLRLCAEEATRIVGDTVAFGATPGQHERIGFTLRVPVGVVCAITPFNSPLNVVVHKAAPALAAGNAVVVKPAPATPLSAALLVELLLEAGLPPGLVTLLQGRGETVGAWLVEEPAIGFYTFTGSTRVGREIQARAGLRRLQLELGSIASTIVCADADLDRAIPKIANAAFRKAGQVCTSTQRLYVERQAAEEVGERLIAAAEAMPAGDPRRPDKVVGPLISTVSAERVARWVGEAAGEGAAVACGGERAGAVLAPTVLRNVRAGMKVFDQEIFGPVVSIIPYDDFGEALAGANATPYGLSAGVFTRDFQKGLRAARTLRFGAVHINEASSARADGMPFGGVKASGYGREGPRYSIREMTEERLVTLND
jgi:succinate-semialdehyde dehydrogenase/glutarate-semialdehyde dehydrogenase